MHLKPKKKIYSSTPCFFSKNFTGLKKEKRIKENSTFRLEK